VNPEPQGFEAMKQLLALVTLMFTMTPVVFAHAVLLEANPAVNSSVPGPDIVVRLRFNSRIDAVRSRLTLVFPNQTVRPLALGQQSSPATLNSRLTGLGAGAYTLRWQVLAADGHISRGEVPFGIK
jgi:hypothetical protein